MKTIKLISTFCKTNKVKCNNTGIIILILLFIFVCYLAVKYQRKKDAYQQNYHIEVEKTFNKMLENSLKEFKQYNDSVLEIAKKINVKPRQIERVLKSTYIYNNYDTTKIYNIHTSEAGLFPIKYESECISYSGIFNSLDSSYTHQFGNCSDKQTGILYKKRKPVNFWLFNLRIGKKEHFATIFSKCKNDTIRINKYIKVK